MALNFPDSPTLNQVYSAGGKTWSYNGSRWVLVIATAIIDVADGSITAAKIADGTIVAAEIANSAITTAKINNNAVTQAKLASNLSAVTVTTTANRDTDIPTPFTGQLAILTDTKKVQLYDGTAWLNITMAPPETPTSLSAIAAPTSVAISFTAGSANGSAITNYKYALSTDGGSTYGSFIALDPADFTTPITVSGLSMNTTYHVKLKAVNDLGDSAASAAVSFTTEGVPAAPTSLSASNITGSTADIAFTAGAANGASISNYKFAVSTDNVTYSAFSALSPADFATPITVTGLTSGTLQYIKLKAVNANGDSAASAAVSFTTLATPGAPTSLSTAPSTLSVVISFTPGNQGGSAITNYQYALSTNGGSTYGSFVALDPADATSPITITGLTAGTAYYVKLKAVNTDGAGAESSAVSFTTNVEFTANYLVVAGGGGGSSGGGGAGGLRSTVTTTGGGGSLETALTLISATNYTVTVGAGGVAGTSNGSNSVFDTITSVGGGVGGAGNGGGASGGSGGGGGAWDSGTSAAGSGTANQGYNGGNNGGVTTNPYPSGGGGGAGGVGGSAGGGGGSGVSISITGSSVTYAGGGNGSSFYPEATVGGNGASNSGAGGHGGGSWGNGGGGGSGIVILRYPSTRTITLGAGLTGSTATVSTDKVTTITAGSGNVSWA